MTDLTPTLIDLSNKLGLETPDDDHISIDMDDISSDDETKKMIDDQIFGMDSGRNDIPVCRICLEDEPDGLFSPCKCKGTNQYVHRICLDQWRFISDNPKAKSHCGTCNYKYNVYQIEKKCCYRFLDMLSVNVLSGMIYIAFMMLIVGYLYQIFDVDRTLYHFVLKILGKNITTDANPDDNQFVYYGILSGYTILLVVLLSIFIHFMKIRMKRDYLRICLSGTNKVKFVQRNYVKMSNHISYVSIN